MGLVAAALVTFWPLQYAAGHRTEGTMPTIKGFPRAALAAMIGALAALALAYLAAVVVLLVTVGIPLGAQPRNPTPVEYIVLLLAGAAAAAAGARVAARVATPYQRHALVIQACLLPPFLIWLFLDSPGWPAWWGPALGAAMAAGTAITAAAALRKRGT